MTRKEAPVTLTGGRGFDFEDAVAAFFELQMITAGKYLGGEYGQIVNLEFQARDSGWLLDDLVVSFRSDDVIRHLAISIKSNQQVTRNGFPSDFVHQAWEQWLGVGPGVFQEGRDLLALAVGRLGSKIKAAWHDLLQEARDTTPDRLLQRIKSRRQSSGLKRAVFQSLLPPRDLRRGRNAEQETARLLPHIRLLHFDFLEDPSGDHARALESCQHVLWSEDAREAQRLWEKLELIASTHRKAGGRGRSQFREPRRWRWFRLTQPSGRAQQHASCFGHWNSCRWCTSCVGC